MEHHEPRTTIAAAWNSRPGIAGATGQKKSRAQGDGGQVGASPSGVPGGPCQSLVAQAARLVFRRLKCAEPLTAVAIERLALPSIRLSPVFRDQRRRCV